MHTIRRMVYRMGFRPKPSSKFFSPSLSIRYYFHDKEIERQKDRWNKGYGI